jgi:uncharacterized protein YeaO (DUF488 family)/putative NADPH-quinone reductase
MRISVILAHPDRKSFNHAIAAAVRQKLQRNGYAVDFHDLYAEGFDPILPAGEAPRGAPLPPAIARHCAEIAQAGGIIIIHPNWWGQPPAILKGWVDRVIRPGVAYEFLEGDQGEGVPKGLLKAKTALVFNTSNTASEREKTIFGDPLQTIWQNCIFALCGIRDFYRKMFGIIVLSSTAQRKEWLEEVGRTVNRYFPPGQPKKNAPRPEDGEPATPDIRTKRVYEPAAADDGFRVLVDRVWPRGMKKEQVRADLWLKEAAPSTALRQWFGHDRSKWEEFRHRFWLELDARPEAVAQLLDAAASGRLTLLFSARDAECNQATALRDYLLARPGRP